MAPAKVAISQTERPTLIFFRRDLEPITADRREVAFERKIGALEVKRKFTVRDMMYRGKLELQPESRRSFLISTGTALGAARDHP
jgi:hypothetical protein